MFITFEGCDGAGKSTQAWLLQDRISRLNISVTCIREPGGTPFGEAIRKLVLEHTRQEDEEPVRIGNTAELLLFTASRAQLVDDIIRPALQRQEVVICDRFIDSTVAYQGYGRGIPLDLIHQANDIATRGLLPDITILLDVSPNVGLTRRHRFMPPDIIERQGLDFQLLVRKGFLETADAYPGRIFKVDAQQAEEKVANDIWSLVGPRLEASSPLMATYPSGRLF